MHQNKILINVDACLSAHPVMSAQDPMPPLQDAVAVWTNPMPPLQDATKKGPMASTFVQWLLDLEEFSFS
jgi:hypothetical protein